MKGFKRALGVQLVRYAANSQAAGVVVLHAAWMLLAAATWQQSGTEGSAVDVVIRESLRAFRWLGGVDADGHGDVDNVLVVWGKLSLLFHLIDAAARKLFGERRPMPLSRIAVASGAAAALGYGFALWPVAAGHGGAGKLPIFFIVVIGSAAMLAAVWAVLARRLAANVVASMQSGAAAPGGRGNGSAVPQPVPE